MLPYPFSYFSSLFPLRKSFQQRKVLSWGQMAFTTLFLIALSLIPVAIQSASRTSQSLSTFIDGVYAPLNDGLVAELADNSQFQEGKLIYAGDNPLRQTDQGKVILGHQDKLDLDQNLTLYFDQDKLQIYKEKKELASISYQGLSAEDWTNKQTLMAALDKAWYQQSRVIVSLFLTMGAGFLLSINVLILIGGAAFFLYLTKKSKLFAFKTFKECMNFTLNCLGLPTMIGCLIGLLGQPLTTIITVENILFVLYLVIVFYQTHYRDKEISV